MYTIKIEPEFQAKCPSFCGLAIYSGIKNSASSELLWKEIDSEIEQIRKQYTVDSIKSRSGILATRQAYKTFGKDPSRYRPACEQLARRVLQNKNLYRVNTVVDILNLVSIVSGYSTAALDASKIVGNDINLGLGRANEPYEGIGRGCLNVENLPIYRDAEGGFATPTSDSVRTMLSVDTKQLLVLINGYDGNKDALTQMADYTIHLLRSYANAGACEIAYF